MCFSVPPQISPNRRTPRFLLRLYTSRLQTRYFNRSLHRNRNRSLWTQYTRWGRETLERRYRCRRETGGRHVYVLFFLRTEKRKMLCTVLRGTRPKSTSRRYIVRVRQLRWILRGKERLGQKGVWAIGFGNRLRVRVKRFRWSNECIILLAKHWRSSEPCSLA